MLYSVGKNWSLLTVPFPLSYVRRYESFPLYLLRRYTPCLLFVLRRDICTLSSASATPCRSVGTFFRRGVGAFFCAEACSTLRAPAAAAAAAAAAATLSCARAGWGLPAIVGLLSILMIKVFLVPRYVDAMYPLLIFLFSVVFSSRPVLAVFCSARLRCC